MADNLQDFHIETCDADARSHHDGDDIDDKTKDCDFVVEKPTKKKGRGRPRKTPKTKPSAKNTTKKAPVVGTPAEKAAVLSTVFRRNTRSRTKLAEEAAIPDEEPVAVPEVSSVSTNKVEIENLPEEADVSTQQSQGPGVDVEDVQIVDQPEQEPATKAEVQKVENVASEADPELSDSAPVENVTKLTDHDLALVSKNVETQPADEDPNNMDAFVSDATEDNKKPDNVRLSSDCVPEISPHPPEKTRRRSGRYKSGDKQDLTIDAKIEEPAKEEPVFKIEMTWDASGSNVGVEPGSIRRSSPRRRAENIDQEISPDLRPPGKRSLKSIVVVDESENSNLNITTKSDVSIDVTTLNSPSSPSKKRGRPKKCSLIDSSQETTEPSKKSRKQPAKRKSKLSLGYKRRKTAKKPKKKALSTTSTIQVSIPFSNDIPSVPGAIHGETSDNVIHVVHESSTSTTENAEPSTDLFGIAARSTRRRTQNSLQTTIFNVEGATIDLDSFTSPQDIVENRPETITLEHGSASSPSVITLDHEEDAIDVVNLADEIKEGFLDSGSDYQPDDDRNDSDFEDGDEMFSRRKSKKKVAAAGKGKAKTKSVEARAADKILANWSEKFQRVRFSNYKHQIIVKESLIIARGTVVFKLFIKIGSEGRKRRVLDDDLKFQLLSNESIHLKIGIVDETTVYSTSAKRYQTKIRYIGNERAFLGANETLVEWRDYGYENLMIMRAFERDCSIKKRSKKDLKQFEEAKRDFLAVREVLSQCEDTEEILERLSDPRVFENLKNPDEISIHELMQSCQPSDLEDIDNDNLMMACKKRRRSASIKFPIKNKEVLTIMKTKAVKEHVKGVMSGNIHSERHQLAVAKNEIDTSLQSRFTYLAKGVFKDTEEDLDLKVLNQAHEAFRKFAPDNLKQNKDSHFRKTYAAYVLLPEMMIKCISIKHKMPLETAEEVSRIFQDTHLFA